LLVEDFTPFRANLTTGDKVLHVESIGVGAEGWRSIAFFGPGQPAGMAQLALERYAKDKPSVEGQIRFLAGGPQIGDVELGRNGEEPLIGRELGLALLTNGRGGMARLQVDLGEAKSKYDCALGANLHPTVPVDRHIFVKRIRVWVVADGFITPLNRESLVSFTPGPPAKWRFVASTGDGRAVEIHLLADMLQDRNTTVFRFVRPLQAPAFGRDLSPESQVSLSVRVDLVDRNFHHERHRDAGAEHYFNTNARPINGRIGFEFTPAPEMSLRVISDAGRYHHESEWSMGVQHPIEVTRGLAASEDAFSPGWFCSRSSAAWDRPLAERLPVLGRR
jgi:hypothetical protein